LERKRDVLEPELATVNAFPLLVGMSCCVEYWGYRARRGVVGAFVVVAAGLELGAVVQINALGSEVVRGSPRAES
jgi:hypothetical protein